MTIQKTLVMIKPDLLEKGYAAVTDVISAYLFKGLVLRQIKYFRMTGPIFEKMYGQHSKEGWFWKLQKYYYLGNFIAMEFEGENAVEVVRQLNGSTNPAKAKFGTIRQKYGEGDNDPTNAVHGSDSPERALEEIAIFWP